MFGNGGMVGTAVALANALGLHRDPSGWGISSLERSLRIRLWWLVLIHDRWCSLAYGTPLQVHRAQYDVPFPTADDLCAVETSPYGRSTASVFIAMTTLTDVLARYLEHIYAVSSSFPVVEQSALDLERMLNEWEEALSAYRSPFRKPDGSYDWETEMDYGWSMLDRQSVGSLAAFIIEPILSTGGILDLPHGYLPRMVAECKKRGMLVIMDEAQTGVGRTGQMFAFEHDGVVPDILALSKTLGCGLPLASVSTTAEIERGCKEAGFLWLTTHLNDPLTAAVGNKVLEIVERDNICQRAAERGAQLRRGLDKLQKRYWCIGDIRGRGLLQGIEIIADCETRAPGPELVQAVSDRAMVCGLSCNLVNLPGMGGVFRLAPPVTVTGKEIEEGLEILDEAFHYVLNQRNLV